MAKYSLTITVDAEQFLPSEDKIPRGVTSDGPRSPRTDPRAKWVLMTNEGMTYLKEGDYVITSEGGDRYVMPQASFEKTYKLVEG